MNKIIIKNLEVFYRVGVTEEERAQPQRLLLTLEMEHDFTEAAQRDDLRKTINYFTVAQRLLHFGEERSWKLIESLAQEIGTIVVKEFHATAVNVEVRKFIIPEAEFVAVISRQVRSAN